MPAPALTRAAPYFEAWNAHDAAAVTAALADGGTYADPVTESPLAGPALAGHVRALIAAFPDLRFEVVSSVPADALPVPLTLPTDGDLEAPGPLRSLAYDRAWWFARFVADTYGTPKLRELYLASCGVGHPDVPTAVHDVLGVDPAGLLVRWHQWVSR